MEVLLDTNGLPWWPKRMGVGGTFCPLGVERGKLKYSIWYPYSL